MTRATLSKSKTRPVLTHLLVACILVLLTNRSVFGQAGASVALNTKADGYAYT